MKDLAELRKPLSIEEIEFRIQSINKGGYATILAYKDARADMNRLDEVVGPLNWKREHTRDNANCIISIWDKEKKEWVSKEDTGKESFTEKEKGLASDSFKRSGFNWGIGRELYDYPLIQLKLYPNEYKVNEDKVTATWDLRLRDWNWKSEFEFNELIYLKAVDQNGNQRFEFKKGQEIPHPPKNGKVTPTEAAWRKAVEKLKIGEVNKDQMKSALNLTSDQLKELETL